MYFKLADVTVKTIIFSAIMHSSLEAFVLHPSQNVLSVEQALPLKALGTRNRSVTVLVTCKNPVSSAQKEYFYAMGVDTIVYAGEMNYYFYLPSSLINSVQDEENVIAVKEVDAQSRIESVNSAEGSLSTLSDDDIIDVNVLFLKELEESEVASYLSQNGIDAEIRKVTPVLRKAELKLRIGDFKKMSHLPLVQYMDKVQSIFQEKSFPLPLETTNYKIAEYSNISQLWKAPYNLNGRNMSVGIVDGGLVLPTHQEFVGGRVHDRTTNGKVNFHATHVAGTIGALGRESKAHGMANEAEIYSYFFGDDAFSEAVLNMYRNDGVLISNHSYGYSLKEHLAEYDSVAATQDITVKNNPYINIFEAAGNDGIDSDYGEYGIIKGPGNSKNIFTIGALNSLSTKVAELSSAGPVKDGRIKPDLCVRGEYVTSASSESDTSYAMMSGTSMATPAATGIGVLVSQAYKRVTGGYDIRHDTLKAVLINTAEDIANPGPDYKAGFGLINAKAAVDTIETIKNPNPKVTVSVIGHSKENSYTFVLRQSSDFKTTIAWVDPEANPSSSVTLVNDIDMLLVSTQTGKVYYPYTLDKTHPSRYAVQTKSNHIDNIEQIEVKNLPAGEYKLLVKGTKIITDIQEYSIASNIPMFSDANIETLKPSKIQNFARKMFLATF